jgi:hypothetical protein
MDEVRMIATLSSQITSLRDTHPDWYWKMDECDPDVCTRSELLDLIITAPNDLVRQYLYGKFTWRTNLSQMTGWPFV